MKPDDPAIDGETERSLVERPQTELIEQRQHVGERDRLATPIDAESPASIGALQQMRGHVGGPTGQGIDVDEVERGNRRVVELVVTGWNGWLQPAGQVATRAQ